MREGALCGAATLLPISVPNIPVSHKRHQSLSVHLIFPSAEPDALRPSGLTKTVSLGYGLASGTGIYPAFVGSVPERLRHLSKATQQASGRVMLMHTCCPEHGNEVTRRYMQASDSAVQGIGLRAGCGSRVLGPPACTSQQPQSAVQPMDSAANHRGVALGMPSTCVVLLTVAGAGRWAFSMLQPTLAPGSWLHTSLET